MIKYLTIVFLLPLSFEGIKTCKHHKQKKIKAIEVLDFSASMGETFYRVYYLDDLLMYQSQYLVDSSFIQFKFDSSTNQFSNNVTLLSSQWKDRFYIFQKDSIYGYNYDPYRSTDDNLRLRADSIIKFVTGTNRFDSFLAIKPDSIIWNADKTEVKEVYFFPQQENIPPGHLSMYYSKNLNHLKESFNRIVDNAKKMKLFKTETIFSEFYSEKDKKLWPPIIYKTEMREFSPEKPEEIIGYFARFKKEVLRKGK